MRGKLGFVYGAKKLNMGFSPYASTQISGGMFFPTSFEFQHFTAE